MLWLQLVFRHILAAKLVVKKIDCYWREGLQVERDKEVYGAIGVSLLCGSIWAVAEIEASLGADRPALQPLWRSSSLLQPAVACSSYSRPGAWFQCAPPEETPRLGRGGEKAARICSEEMEADSYASRYWQLSKTVVLTTACSYCMWFKYQGEEGILFLNVFSVVVACFSHYACIT